MRSFLEFIVEDQLLFAPGAKFRVDYVDIRSGWEARVMLTCVSDGL